MTQLAAEAGYEASEDDPPASRTWDVAMRLFDDAMTLSAAPRTAIEMMNLALDVLEDSHGPAD